MLARWVVFGAIASVVVGCGPIDGVQRVQLGGVDFSLTCHRVEPALVGSALEIETNELFIEETRDIITFDPCEAFA